MKILRGPGEGCSVKLDGHWVTFKDFTAEVPDAVADWAAAKWPDRYKIDRQHVPADSESVLVVRDAGLGDVLLVTPLLRALKRRGVARLGVATRSVYAPLLAHNPDVDAVHTLDGPSMLPGGYGQTIDLRQYVEHREQHQKSYLNRVDAFGRAAEVTFATDDARRLTYVAAEGERREARRLLQRNRFADSPVCALVLRASQPNRSLRPGDVWALARILWNRHGIRSAVLDHEPQDIPEGVASPDRVIDLTGRLSIRQAGAVIAESDVVCAPDTGLFHLASALDKPVVTYFGAFPLAERQSHGRVTDCVQRGGCKLLPCRHYYCLNRTEAGTPRCLPDPEVLADAVARSIARDKETNT